MQADPSAQLRLLDLQRIDTAISQLEHRAKTLPEHAQLKQHQAVRAALAQELVAAETVVSDATAAQKRAESDLEPVRARLVRDQQMVDDGGVTDPKVLRSMLDEIEHLVGRIATLEDSELELMQALEDAEQARDQVRQRKTEVEDQMRALIATRDQAVAQLSADVAAERGRRGQVVKDLPAGLVDLYEKVRARSGYGAAELKGRRCTGCGLEATPADYNRYQAAPANEVLRCEECSAVLVRTEQ
ncbi:MAG: C4-type zinc ribbon domain-containing protein [Actinomycetia bacterium]|nr:C4-type zinc ribbon domain-containing protein [Actinomycetes bacterium]